MSKINLRVYEAPNNVDDTQAAELIMQNAAKCEEIKHVAPNPDMGIAELKGKFYKYIIEHKHGKIHVKTKFDYLLSMILAFICMPFALWFGYAFGRSDILAFKDFGLPLAILLIVWGIVWTIAYALGGKEQNTILTYIYNTLCGNPLNTENEAKNAGTSSIIIGLIPLLIGIVILILYLVT